MINSHNVYTLFCIWTSSISPTYFHHIVLNFMLCNSFFAADPVWKTALQIALQDYFIAAFKEVEPTEKYKFSSIYVPRHKKKKLYALLVFKTLKTQLYDSSIDIVRCLHLLFWEVFRPFGLNYLGKNLLFFSDFDIYSYGIFLITITFYFFS